MILKITDCPICCGSDRVDGLERIRISSIEASQIDEKMLDVLNRSSKMCRHLHIPPQAGMIRY